MLKNALQCNSVLLLYTVPIQKFDMDFVILRTWITFCCKELKLEAFPKFLESILSTEMSCIWYTSNQPSVLQCNLVRIISSFLSYKKSGSLCLLLEKVVLPANCDSVLGKAVEWPLFILHLPTPFIIYTLLLSFFTIVRRSKINRTAWKRTSTEPQVGLSRD